MIDYSAKDRKLNDLVIGELSLFLPLHPLTMSVQEGHSVLAIVTDFFPYFYIATPRGFGDDDAEAFARHLNVRSPPDYSRSRLHTIHRHVLPPLPFAVLSS